MLCHHFGEDGVVDWRGLLWQFVDGGGRFVAFATTWIGLTVYYCGMVLWSRCFPYVQ